MIHQLPPCPSCGGVLRATGGHDAVRCRCGLEIDGEAIAAYHSRKSSPFDVRSLLASGSARMVSPPVATPGIRVSDSFRELSKDCWDGRQEVVMTTDAQAALSLAGAEAARAAGLDTVLGIHRGEHLIVKGPDGDQKQLHRDVMYGLAPWGREGQAAAEMVKAIAVKHGPGKLRSMLAIVHPIADDGMMRVANIGGVPHAYLRALYFHEPVPKAPAASGRVGGQVSERPPTDSESRNGATTFNDGSSLKHGSDPSSAGRSLTRTCRYCSAPATCRTPVRRMGKSYEFSAFSAPQAQPEIIDSCANKACFAQACHDAIPLAVGDHVEWYPDARGLDDSLGTRRVTGTIRAMTGNRYVFQLEVASTSGFSYAPHGLTFSPLAPKPGTLVDPSCSPGIIRRCATPVPVERKPYAPVPATCPMCGKACDSSKVSMGESDIKLYGCSCVPTDRMYSFSWVDRAEPTLTPAGRMEAVIEMAQSGAISAKAARALLNGKQEPIDQLDIEYDGVKLRTLLDGDAFNRREESDRWKSKPMTPAQRSAVSAHWSAQLRSKVEAAKVKECNQVQMPIDAEDLEW